MRKMLLPLCFLLSMVSLSAEEITRWTLDTKDSFVNFTVNIQGTPSSGTFNAFTADIAFDPKKLDQSRLTVIFDLNHITATYRDVADNLKKKPWLYVEHYPKARFVGHQFTHVSGKNYTVTGDLTLRGTTRKETLYFSLLSYKANHAVIEGTMTLKRRDYQIGQDGWQDTSIVADEVLLKVRVTGTKQDFIMSPVALVPNVPLTGE